MSRFLAAYENYFAKRTDAPVEFGHASGLAVLSALSLGKRWMERGGKINTNLFMLLTADSSRDRKSTSVGIGLDIVSAIEPKRIGPDDFTAEAIVNFLGCVVTSKIVDDKGNTKEEKMHKPPGRIVLPIEEFGTYLAASRTYAKTLPATMCRLYDGKRIEKVRTTGKTSIIVEDPIVGMFGGVAYGMLEHYANETDWVNGFFARILWITPLTRRAPYLAPPPTPKTAGNLATDAAKDIYLELCSSDDGEMYLTQAAEDIHTKYVESMQIADERGADQAWIATRERLLNAALKLSILYQIDIDSSRNISDVAMDRACNLARQIWTSFKIVYARCAGTRQARLFRRVWEYMSNMPLPKRKDDKDGVAGTGKGEVIGGGVTRRDLYRNLNVSVSDLIPILDTLIHGGIIGYKEIGTEKVPTYYIIQEMKKPEE